MKRLIRLAATLLPVALLLTPASSMAADIGLPAVSVQTTPGGGGGQTYTLTLQVLALMTALTLLPAILLMMTAFTRVIIVLSILRTRQPGLGGPFPEPARQLLEDLGLTVFIVVLGLNAGAGVAKAMSGGTLAPIVIGSFVVGLLPAIVAWVIGFRLFKMNTALLLGAIAGGRCNSAGMRAAQEVSRSTVPAMSYPVTFAISNIVLTVMSYAFALVG